MHRHANARLTPRGRAAVFELVEAGMTVTAACLAARVSRRFYYRWLPRWRADGGGGLIDRSSRPRSSPQRLSVTQEAHILGLRRATGWGPDRIAAVCGAPASTVHRVLRRHDLVGRKREPVAVVRYEHAKPGGLVHLDTKKLGRIVGGPGTGRRAIHGTIAGASAGRSSTWPSTTPPASSTPNSWLKRRPAPRRASGSARCAGSGGRASSSSASSPTRERLPEPALRTARAPARPAPFPDPSLPPADQREGRALDPDGPLGVPLSRGLRQLQRATACARSLHRLLQRAAPSPGHRWPDPSSAAHREAGGLTV